MSDAPSQATNPAGSLAGQVEREIFLLHNHGNRKSLMAALSQAPDCRPSALLPRLPCCATGCCLVRARPTRMPRLPPHAGFLLPVGFLSSVPCGGAYESQNHRQQPGERHMHSTDTCVTFLTRKETHIKTVKTSTFSSSSGTHV